MQLSNIYDVSKTKLYGKMNSINTPIFRVFYVKAVWGHARAELIEAEDTITCIMLQNTPLVAESVVEKKVKKVCWPALIA